MLTFDRKQQNSVKAIFLLTKKKKKKDYVVQRAGRTIFLLAERIKNNQRTIDGHNIV